MEVALISITEPLIQIEGKSVSPEGLIAYCARVSSPNQENPEHYKLLEYCIKNGHWSVFEMVDMTVEIKTTRAISPQILRHRSFCFQEFSQRYARINEEDFELYHARKQDVKNRQNSIDAVSAEEQEWFLIAQKNIQEQAYSLYNSAIEKGIAKECARTLLPMSTKTKIYMKGSVRSWIHYIQLRTHIATQKEHRDIALGIKNIFVQHFPITSKALAWQPE